MNEFTKLTREIELYNWMIFGSTAIILALMATVTVVAVVSTRQNLLWIVVALGVMWPYTMNRYDYMIQRAGAYLSENYPGKWEGSEIRHRQLWRLVVADIGSAIGIIGLFGFAVSRTWRTSPYLSGAAVGMFLIGLLLLVSLPAVFPKKPS